VALRDDVLAGPASRLAVGYLRELFAGPDALDAVMAGRAEQLVGDPAVVSAAVAALAGDVLDLLDGAADQ
jgi:ABC-type amino acid transport substrate-binding protein